MGTFGDGDSQPGSEEQLERFYALVPDALELDQIEEWHRDDERLAEEKFWEQLEAMYPAMFEGCPNCTGVCHEDAPTAEVDEPAARPKPIRAELAQFNTVRLLGGEVIDE